MLPTPTGNSFCCDDYDQFNSIDRRLDFSEVRMLFRLFTLHFVLNIVFRNVVPTKFSRNRGRIFICICLRISVWVCVCCVDICLCFFFLDFFKREEMLGINCSLVSYSAIYALPTESLSAVIIDLSCPTGKPP